VIAYCVADNQLLQKSPVFCRTQKFKTISTRLPHWSLLWMTSRKF